MKRARVVLACLLTVLFLFSSVMSAFAAVTDIHIRVSSWDPADADLADTEWLQDFEITLEADAAEDLSGLTMTHNFVGSNGLPLEGVLIDSLEPLEPKTADGKYYETYQGTTHFNTTVLTSASITVSLTTAEEVVVNRNTTVFDYGPLTAEPLFAQSLSYQLVRPADDVAAAEIRFTCATVPLADRYEFFLKGNNGDITMDRGTVDGGQAAYQRSLADLEILFNGSGVESFAVIAYQGNIRVARAGYVPVNTVSGIVSLPDGDVAPAGGYQISMELMKHLGYVETAIPCNIAENTTSAAWSLVLPMSGTGDPEARYGIQAHVDTPQQQYVISSYWTPAGSTPGFKAMGQFAGDNVPANLNVPLIKGIPVGGNILIPEETRAVMDFTRGIDVSYEIDLGASGADEADLWLHAFSTCTSTAISAPYTVMIPEFLKEESFRVGAGFWDVNGDWQNTWLGQNGSAVNLGQAATLPISTDGAVNPIPDLTLMPTTPHLLQQVSGTLSLPAGVPVSSEAPITVVVEACRPYDEVFASSFPLEFTEAGTRAFSLTIDNGGEPYTLRYSVIGNQDVGVMLDMTWNPELQTMQGDQYNCSNQGDLTGVSMQLVPAYRIRGSVILPEPAASGIEPFPIDVRFNDTNGTPMDGGDDIGYGTQVQVTEGAEVIPYLVRVPAHAASYRISTWAEAKHGYAQEAYYTETGNVYRWDAAELFSVSGDESALNLTMDPGILMRVTVKLPSAIPPLAGGSEVTDFVSVDVRDENWNGAGAGVDLAWDGEETTEVCVLPGASYRIYASPTQDRQQGDLWLARTVYTASSDGSGGTFDSWQAGDVVDAAGNYSMTMVTGKKITGDLVLPVAADKDYPFIVDARVLNGTYGDDPVSHADDVTTGMDITVKSGKISTPFSLLVPSDATDLVLGGSPQANDTSFLPWMYYVEDYQSVQDMYAGKRFDLTKAETVTQGLKLQMVSGAIWSGTLTVPAEAGMNPDGKRAYVNAFDGDRHVGGTEIIFSGNVGVFKVALPIGHYRLDYSFSGEDFDPTTLGSCFQGGVIRADGSTSPLWEDSEVVDFTANRTMDLVAATGNRVTGTIKLPGTDVAEQEMAIRANVEGIDGTNWYQDHFVKIPQGENAITYSLLVPKAMPDATYLVKYEVLSDMRYVSRMTYDSTRPGNVVMRWEGEKLALADSLTMLTPMELVPGVNFSGTYTLPEPATELLRMSLNLWSESAGVDAGMYYQIEEGDTSFDWSVTVMGGTEAEPVMYQLDHYFNDPIAAPYVASTILAYTGTPAASDMTAYYTDKVAIPAITGQPLSGFDIGPVVGARVTGTIYATSAHPAFETHVRVIPVSEPWKNNEFSWETLVPFEEDQASAPYSLVVPYDLKTWDSAYRYHLEAGTYNNNGFVTEVFFEDAATTVVDFSQSAELPLTSTGLTGMDLHLVPGRVVQGTINLPDGYEAPNEGQWISVEANSGARVVVWRDCFIDAGSSSYHYEMTVPYEQDYTFAVHTSQIPGSTGRLVEQNWYKAEGVMSGFREQAEPVFVGADTTPLTINLSVLEANLISGTVKLPDQAHPSQEFSVWVQLIHGEGTEHPYYADAEVVLSDVVREATYTLALAPDAPPDGYLLGYFSDPTQNDSVAMGARWYEGMLMATDKYSPRTLAEVLASPDLTLLPGRPVSGTIRIPHALGEDVFITVAAMDGQEGREWWSFKMPAGQTQTDYAMTLPYLAPHNGLYQLLLYMEMETPPFLNTWYAVDGAVPDQGRATMLDLTAGPVTDADVNMLPLGVIEGNLLIPGGAKADMNVTLAIKTPSQDDFWFSLWEPIAVKTGDTSVPYAFTVPVSQEDHLYVLFTMIDPGKGVAQINAYKDATTSVVDFMDGTPFAVTTAGKTGMNLVLNPGVNVTGTLSLPAGQIAAENLDVFAVAYTNNHWNAAQRLTLPAGASSVPYMLTVAPGTYRFGNEVRTVGTYVPYAFLGAEGSVIGVENAIDIAIDGTGASGLDMVALQTGVTTPPVSAKSGAGVRIPVSVTAAYHVAGGTLSLSYDATKLDFLSVETEQGFVAVVNKPAAGQVDIALASSLGRDGDFNLCTLVFQVLGAAGTETTLAGTGSTVEDDKENTMPVVWQGGRVKIFAVTYGNVGLESDEAVTAADAALVLGHAAGHALLTGDSLIAADVNDDGFVDVGDAVLILRKVVGLIGSFPVEMK